MIRKTFPLIGEQFLGWALFWLIIFLLVNALAVSLTNAIRGLNATWLIPLGSLAIIYGWVMGGFNRKKPVSFMIGLLTGLLLLVLLLSDAGKNLVDALLEAFHINVRFALLLKEKPEPTKLFMHLLLSLANIESLIINLWAWLTDFFQLQPRYNPVIGRFLWGELIWVALFTSGWLFRRKMHAFLASSPLLILQISVLGFTRQNTMGLIMSMSCLLVLIVLNEHMQREEQWKSSQYDYSLELRIDIASQVISVVLVIMLIASVIPNISIRGFKAAIDDLVTTRSDQQLDLAESLGLEQIPREPRFETGLTGMPRNHLIGSGPELSEIIVMTVDSGEIFLPPQAAADVEIPNYYWFGRSYDIYTGTGWRTSEIRTQEILPDEIIRPANLAHAQIHSFSFQKTADASPALYAPGIPQSVNQPVTVSFRESTGEFFGAQLVPHDYQVESPVLSFPEKILLQFHSSPPPEISANYLQIPEDLPERVTKLAERITNGLTTPYEKALAIETFLRKYAYTLDLPRPPQNRDIVDYFLFEIQEGYCDYFASAMVILARSSGLPSRLATGYTSGVYDFVDGVFIITEANAHAWPEIYIAPVGWIPFEPTAHLAPFSWTEDDVVADTIQLTSLDPSEIKEASIWLNLLGLTFLFVVLAIAGFAWYWLFQKQQHPPSTTYQIEKIYQGVKTHLDHDFLHIKSRKTPLEFLHELNQYFEEQINTKLNRKLSLSMAQDLETLTDLYQQGVYSPQPLQEHNIKAARKQRLRLLIRSRLLSLMLVFNKDKP